jgi:hypothetical protein
VKIIRRQQTIQELIQLEKIEVVNFWIFFYWTALND